MNNWTKGNEPNQDGIYWVTINKNGESMMYDSPVRYVLEKWKLLSLDWEIPKEDIIAYSKIIKPRSFNAIGNGIGFYIRTICTNNGEVSITEYGKGLQLASWCMIGYSSIEKAVTAAKRLKKIDIDANYLKEKYEIIDGHGKIIKEI